MPLLMCPNDNAPMQTLDRHGVQFDMCPTCRGVWLDRGELEKLMESATDEGRAATSVAPTYAPPPQQAPRQAQQQPWGGQPTYSEPPRHRDDRYDRRRDDDYHYRKKKKRMDIFDIFD